MKINKEQKALTEIKIILNNLIEDKSEYSPEDYLTDIEVVLDNLDKKVLANKDLTYIKISIDSHFEKIGRGQKSQIGLLFENLIKCINKIDVENTMPYSREKK